MLLVTLCACASSVVLAPEAAKIRIITDGSAVAGCEILGAVESSPPYITASDATNQLKNNAAPLGADTVLLTSRHVNKGRSGMAYKCAN